MHSIPAGIRVCVSAMTSVEKLKIIEVSARDMAIQYDILQNLKNEQSEIEKLKSLRDSIVQGTNFEARYICAMCCKSFSFFRKPHVCIFCNTKVCTECLSKSRSKVCCRICHKEKHLDRKTHEWSLMYPYQHNSFAYRKLTAVIPNYRVGKQVDSFAWFLRAAIEQYIYDILKINIDEADLDFYFRDQTVQLCYLKLFDTFYKLVENFSTSHRITDDVYSEVENYLNSTLNNLKQTVKELTECGKFPDSLPDRDRSINYYQLLANATINKIFEKEMYCMDSGISVGIQTEGEGESGPELLPIDSASQLRINRRRRPPFPQIFVSTDDADSVFDADDSTSISVHHNDNWFFKNDLLSPSESIYSSNCHPTASIVSLMNANKFDYLETHDDLSPCQSESENTKRLLSSCSEFAEGAPVFEVYPKSVCCSAGEKAVFSCSVAGAEPIDVSWYNSKKELADVGRCRIFSSGAAHWLEIYDCVPLDSDEIVCMAINEQSVCNHMVHLKVEDRDIAGEEPIFVHGIESVSIKEGENLWLKCKVVGEPEPRLTFYYENKVICNRSDGHVKIDNKNGFWTLWIEKINVSWSGKFKAVARNRMGETSCFAVVNVKQRLSNRTSEESNSYLQVPSVRPQPIKRKSKQI